MRFYIFGLLALLLVPSVACRPARPRPNIILILVDTLRADYLGAYGFRGAVSPHVDALAGESIVFRNCFTPAPWTKPAVASLFTSLYPQVHGLTNHEGKYWGDETPGLKTGVLSERAVTLAEGLREQGYRTAGFVSNPWVTTAYGFAQGFDFYHEKETGLTTTVDDLADDARSWIEALDSDEPYFLYLHFMDVHAPYNASHEDYRALQGSRDVYSGTRLGPNELPDLRWSNIEVRPDWATDEMRREVRYWRARYASGVRAFDRRLGKLLGWLRETGELERSLLVFTSDHGEELHEHGDWSHGQNLYDHQLHVPLMVRNPGGRGGGAEVHSFVELVDLMPTLLSLAGTVAPERAQGRDVSVLLEGGATEDPDVTFATATQRVPGLYSVRTPSHKLTYEIDTEQRSLFDIVRDGDEQRDIAARQPKIADELQDRLLTYIRDSVSGGTLEAETAEIPPELKERLEALGYLQ